MTLSDIIRMRVSRNAHADDNPLTKLVQSHVNIFGPVHVNQLLTCDVVHVNHLASNTCCHVIVIF